MSDESVVLTTRYLFRAFDWPSSTLLPCARSLDCRLFVLIGQGRTGGRNSMVAASPAIRPMVAIVDERCP
jgi:hypothetical protein